MQLHDQTESPRLRVARRRIASTRVVTLGELADDEREALCARSFALYTRYKSGVQRATFDRQFFADDAARAAFFYGEDGAFAGFSCASRLRVGHAGQVHAVFTAPLFIDTDYRGSREAARFALGEALRCKLREPWTPMAYLGVVTSPASYRMLATAMPTVYPRRDAPTPAAVDSLVRAVAARRGLVFADEERWLVRGLGAVREPGRLLRSEALRRAPEAQFYVEQNPGFRDGMALLTWVPLTLGNLGGGLARLARRAPGG